MRLFLYTLRIMPGISWVKLTPAIAMLIAYLAMGEAGVLGVSGFVWANAVLLIGTYLVNGGIILAGKGATSSVGGAEKRGAMTGFGLFVVTLACAQVWLNDPVFSQRIWTFSCLFFALAFAGFYLFDRASLARFPYPWRDAPDRYALTVPIEVLMFLTFLVLNEWMIRHAQLGTWISVRAITPILIIPAVRWATMLVLLVDASRETGPED